MVKKCKNLWKKRLHSRAKLSLKWSLIFLVLICWILPLAVISIFTGYYINNSINQQITSTVSESVEHALDLCTDRLNNAIQASRNASYVDSELAQTYEDYLIAMQELKILQQRKDAGESTGLSGEPLPTQHDLNTKRNMLKNTLYDVTVNFLSQQYRLNEKFVFTSLFFCDDPETIYYTKQLSYEYEKVRAYEDSGAHEQAIALSKTLATDVGFLSVNNRLYMVRNMMQVRNYTPYAVLVMEIDQNTVFDSLKNGVAWNTLGDEHEDVTVGVNGSYVGLRGEQMDFAAMGIDIPEKDGNGILKENDYRNVRYGTRRYRDFDLHYAIRVDASELMKQFSDFRKILLYIGILIIPMLAAVLKFFYSNVSHPIDRFIHAYKHLENGELGTQITEHFNNQEFAYFTRAFNDMSKQLKYQFERIYEEELALRDAKIMALQSQINPHFLNNTLEIINWEARMEDNVKVSRMIESLSIMLDAAMDRKGRPEVHLSEEMMYVDAYLYIISERLGKRLTVTKEIDQSLLDLYVPRLVMQPIIENAVEHGIEPRQKGNILIRIYQQEGNLILEVANDGKMTEEDEQKIAYLLSDEFDPSTASSFSLGIRNVHQRLRIIYGENSGLTIKRDETGTALAKIVIPINHTVQ